MKTTLTFGEFVAALMITALLASPQAFAQLSDYTTDMGEPDIMIVHSEKHPETARLKQAANVEINVAKAFFPNVKKIKIYVFDESNQQVAQFATSDRVIYMHLTEGKYTVKVDAAFDHTQVVVEADDDVLKKYTV